MWKRVTLAAALLAGCVSLDAPVRELSLDSSFTDWSGARRVEVDEVARWITAAVDDRYLHLHIEFREEAALQALSRTVTMAIDADGAASGASWGGLDTADLGVAFSPEDPRRPGSLGGLGIWKPGAESLAVPASVDFIHAPVHAATTFEMRLDRSALPVNGNLKIRFSDPSAPRRESEVVTVPVAPATRRPDEPLQLDRGSSGSFRVLAWNVADQSFLANGETIGRILAAVNADVLLLDEVTEKASPGDIERVLGMAGEGWRYVRGEGGGYQRSVVATRQPVRAAPAMTRIEFMQDEVTRLMGMAGERDRERLRSSLADGLGTVGAFVTLGRREVLFVPVDLWCCGGKGSWQDERRMAEVSGIRRGITASVHAGEPVIVGGDFNLVGTARPLLTMRVGLDTDGSELEMADPHRSRDALNATWYDARDKFTPGRLDFMLYPGTLLRVTRAFVFDSSDVPESDRVRLNLAAEDSAAASDHRPIVVDFEWR